MNPSSPWIPKGNRRCQLEALFDEPRAARKVTKTAGQRKNAVISFACRCIANCGRCPCCSCSRLRDLVAEGIFGRIGANTDNFPRGSFFPLKAVGADMQNKLTAECNILLDFLNPDLRKAWQLAANNKAVQQRLRRLTNLSLVWSHSYCVLPVAFVFEDTFVTRLLRRHAASLTSGLIRIPMKGNSDFYTKGGEILSEYHKVKDNYNQLMSTDDVMSVADFLTNHGSFSKYEKGISTGSHIADCLERNSDNPDSHWKPFIERYSASTVSRLNKYLRYLLENGIALTHWQLIDEFHDIVDSYDIHRMLHTAFGDAYISEYALTAMYNVMGEHSFSPIGNSRDRRYDYEYLRAVLEPLGLLTAISEMHSRDIVKIRHSSNEWSKFRRSIQSIIATSENCEDARARVVGIALRSEMLKTRLNTGYTGRNSSVQELIDTVGEYNMTMEKDESPSLSRPAHQVSSTPPAKGKSKYVVYVALGEEEEIVAKSLGLAQNSATGHFEGVIEHASFTLISSRQMGRVSAALCCFKYLHELPKDERDNLSGIIVLGLAGGFAKNGVRRGDLLIPQNIYDVANTKKEGAINGEGPFEEFRSMPHRVNQELCKLLLNKARFNEDLFKVFAKIESRKKELDLTIHVCKPMCCCDSVIKDEDWISRIITVVHPDLCGVDMESTGVCQAVDLSCSRLPVLVVRGVSDMANAYKADDDWRTKAMYSATSMIKYLAGESLL